MTTEEIQKAKDFIKSKGYEGLAEHTLLARWCAEYANTARQEAVEEVKQKLTAKLDKWANTAPAKYVKNGIRLAINDL